MQKRIIFFSFLLAVACYIPVSVTAQTIKNFIEKDPPQYGKPFKNVPQSRNATIYQVNIRAFSKEGNFKGVLARLDSIKALGINVVYLMPIYPVGIIKTSNSPYCVRNYKAINSEFGNLSDLRAIVDGVHSRNMAIILDWVPNHTSFDNNWTINKSWYLQDSSGNIISPPGTGWNDVAQLNYKNADMRLAMINAMKYWVLTANVDGFRCDYADGQPVDFWVQAIDTLRNMHSHKLLMLAEGTRSANFEAGFNYNFGFRFFEDLEKIYSSNRSVLSIDSLNITDYKDASDSQFVVRYITNHDVNGSDGTPLSLFDGKKGSMAAFIVAAYMKSVPMIYDGQEVGMATPIVFPFTSVNVNWNQNPDVTAEYKKIIGFRNSSNVIRDGSLISYDSDDACVFTKSLNKQKVLVMVNMRNAAINYTIPSELLNTTWKDAISGGNVTLAQQFTLTPYSYHLLEK